ncbi:TonB-dependent receptor [Xanthocytophaga agilis]|uniref:TonB-dependent receptor n=1 Tax=Xanthocytophaga agilis TaxID=3048010 RepID=A0AAE3UDY4_9BACT|nr:TonB-dependent receptor [Xanthocytophaga agilis]MDJ1501690.1 TonB-dependent receptor [Xanthocytophaga agilis]
MQGNKNSLLLSLTLSLFGILSIIQLVTAQSTGNLKGRIIEQSTKQPLAGVSVLLDNTTFGAVTDTAGIFSIKTIPAGSYSLTISMVGFQTKKINEITITSNKTYYSEFELLEDIGQLSEVTVVSFKGENNPLTPVSSYSFSREEIFRSPGAQGDIMRALSVLPGVVSSGAQFSAIAARGQGTQDNIYMVDDMPMFNLSHLEAEGFNSGFNDPNGGRFSIFAPRIIDNVQFQNGGFDAVYGRKSSSYLSLGIKEGNKASWSFGGQFDLLGATLIADGPISPKTSLFTSGRYHNFAALQNVLNIQNPSFISFGDYLLKTTTQINVKNKLSLVVMYNPESTHRNIDAIGGETNLNEDNSAGTVLWNHRGSKAIAGFNLQTLTSTSSYWKNILYYRSSTVDNNFGRFSPSLSSGGDIINPRSGRYEDKLRSIKNNQQEIGYRSIYTKHYDNLTVTAGIDAMVLNLDYRRTLSRIDTVYTFRSTDVRPSPSQYYQIVDPSQFNSVYNKSTFNGSGYIALSWTISPRFTLNPGIRYDFTGFSDEHTVSPRLSGSFALNDKHSINFATGLYYQDAAYADVAGQSEKNKINNERVIQSILGYKLQFSPDLKLVVEGWHKQFNNLVVQPNRMQSFLTNTGDGYAYGADISLVKRLSRKYYGQIGYSYMVSKRDDHTTLGEYNYIFSIPHTLNILASYKPTDKWIFSGKFRYSTGRPTDEYIVYSDVLNDPNKIRYGQQITAVNGRRLADYFSLDIRVDYYVPMKRGTFSAFLDLVNVTNRFNVNSEIFLPETGRTFNIGLGVFPTFGVRVDL